MSAPTADVPIAAALPRHDSELDPVGTVGATNTLAFVKLSPIAQAYVLLGWTKQHCSACEAALWLGEKRPQ